MRQWRQWFVKLHVYGGLVCSAYIVIFGLSSLNFNHHFVGHEPETRHWERSVSVEVPRPVPAGDDASAVGPDAQKAREKSLQDLCENLRNQLGLFGWVLKWETWVEDNGDLHTEIRRPGRQYEIVVKGGLAKVEERRMGGVWAVVMPLHGLRFMPNSALVSSWAWYTELTTWFVVFMALSGVYLWTFRQAERRTGMVLLLSTSAAGAAFFTYVVLWA